ncbi:MAG: rhodanese-like domain-containing protein [Bdellovibrionota bacterium]
MPSILNRIGFFQFENLIKNRIPFILFAIDFEMPVIFTNFHEQHLINNRVSLKSAALVDYIKEKNLPKDQAMVLICESGKVSPDLVDKVEAMGFHNVYYIDGGLENLLKEKAES